MIKGIPFSTVIILAIALVSPFSRQNYNHGPLLVSAFSCNPGDDRATSLTVSGGENFACNQCTFQSSVVVNGVSTFSASGCTFRGTVSIQSVQTSISITSQTAFQGGDLTIESPKGTVVLDSISSTAGGVILNAVGSGFTSFTLNHAVIGTSSTQKALVFGGSSSLSDVTVSIQDSILTAGYMAFGVDTTVLNRVHFSLNNVTLKAQSYAAYLKYTPTDSSIKFVKSRIEGQVYGMFITNAVHTRSEISCTSCVVSGQAPWYLTSSQFNDYSNTTIAQSSITATSSDAIRFTGTTTSAQSSHTVSDSILKAPVYAMIFISGSAVTNSTVTLKNSYFEGGSDWSFTTWSASHSSGGPLIGSKMIVENATFADPAQFDLLSSSRGEFRIHGHNASSNIGILGDKTSSATVHVAQSTLGEFRIKQVQFQDGDKLIVSDTHLGGFEFIDVQMLSGSSGNIHNTTTSGSMYRGLYFLRCELDQMKSFNISHSVLKGRQFGLHFSSCAQKQTGMYLLHSEIVTLAATSFSNYGLYLEGAALSTSVLSLEKCHVNGKSGTGLYSGSSSTFANKSSFLVKATTIEGDAGGIDLTSTPTTGESQHIYDEAIIVSKGGHAMIMSGGGSFKENSKMEMKNSRFAGFYSSFTTVSNSKINGAPFLTGSSVHAEGSIFEGNARFDIQDRASLTMSITDHNKSSSIHVLGDHTNQISVSVKNSLLGELKLQNFFMTSKDQLSISNTKMSTLTVSSASIVDSVISMDNATFIGTNFVPGVQFTNAAFSGTTFLFSKSYATGQNGVLFSSCQFANSSKFSISHSYLTALANDAIRFTGTTTSAQSSHTVSDSILKAPVYAMIFISGSAVTNSTVTLKNSYFEGGSDWSFTTWSASHSSGGPLIGSKMIVENATFADPAQFDLLSSSRGEFRIHGHNASSNIGILGDKTSSATVHVAQSTLGEFRIKQVQFQDGDKLIVSDTNLITLELDGIDFLAGSQQTLHGLTTGGSLYRGLYIASCTFQFTNFQVENSVLEGTQFGVHIKATFTNSTLFFCDNTNISTSAQTSFSNYGFYIDTTTFSGSKLQIHDSMLDGKTASAFYADTATFKQHSRFEVIRSKITGATGGIEFSASGTSESSAHCYADSNINGKTENAVVYRGGSAFQSNSTLTIRNSYLQGDGVTFSSTSPSIVTGGPFVNDAKMFVEGTTFSNGDARIDLVDSSALWIQNVSVQGSSTVPTIYVYGATGTEVVTASLPAKVSVSTSTVKTVNASEVEGKIKEQACNYVPMTAQPTSSAPPLVTTLAPQTTTAAQIISTTAAPPQTTVLPPSTTSAIATTTYVTSSPQPTTAKPIVDVTLTLTLTLSHSKQSSFPTPTITKALQPPILFTRTKTLFPTTEAPPASSSSTMPPSTSTSAAPVTSTVPPTSTEAQPSTLPSTPAPNQTAQPCTSLQDVEIRVSCNVSDDAMVPTLSEVTGAPEVTFSVDAAKTIVANDCEGNSNLTSRLVNVTVHCNTSAALLLKSIPVLNSGAAAQGGLAPDDEMNWLPIIIGIIAGVLICCCFFIFFIWRRCFYRRDENKAMKDAAKYNRQFNHFDADEQLLRLAPDPDAMQDHPADDEGVGMLCIPVATTTTEAITASKDSTTPLGGNSVSAVAHLIDDDDDDGKLDVMLGDGPSDPIPLPAVTPQSTSVTINETQHSKLPEDDDDDDDDDIPLPTDAVADTSKMEREAML